MAALRPLLLCLLLCCLAAGAAGPPEPPEEEKAALLAFLAQTPHEDRVRWDASAGSPCAWTGVSCDAGGSHVVALRLPGVGLVGPIPPNTLSRLPALRVLSLRDNRLSGSLPADLAGLPFLRALYLQGNLLSGELPAWLPGLPRLTRLDLSGNHLTGSIPASLGNLTRLTGLFLDGNGFSGALPAIDLPGMTGFDVSRNGLEGPIPEPLRRFPASSFAGNLGLCGGPLAPCNPPISCPAEDQGRDKLVAAISVASGAVLLLALLLLLVFCCRRRRKPKTQKAPAPEVAGETADAGGEGEEREGERNELVFMGKGGYRFGVEELLRASAEVMGKGSAGTSYKAVMEEGRTVVVKRLKEVAASRVEFEAVVGELGKVEHADVVAPRAFYYSSDEKLLVFDYFPAGSLAALLHGSRGSGRTPLGWDTRMRISLAAGRGLAHLHTAAHLAHGNVRASNVLLRPDHPSFAAVSEFGLSPLLATPPPPSRVAAGYLAPELLETREPTSPSDVYSFGVLLLELLTGRSPNQPSPAGDEEVFDLPRWVQSVVREEWTAEVFDPELARCHAPEEEMVRVLQLAMACVATVPRARPEMGRVVRVLEDVVGRGDGPSKGGSGGSTPPAAASP